ncbi:MAG: dodecin flavoprotein [Gammaproteobacteria bacterium]|jgi:flavin-binding protein dodecin|nr:dodecin flavoprotein [Gammaproteobacteria bacterium]
MVVIKIISQGVNMSAEKSYLITEVVGTSKESIEAAIQGAVTDAYKKIKHIRWFEVVETRGHVKDGKIQYFQVTIKLGFSE